MIVCLRLSRNECEPKLAQYLNKGLTEEGFSVHVCNGGLDGLQVALKGEYDAIVLDRMLPGLDGLALLTALRSQIINAGYHADSSRWFEGRS